MNTQLLHLLTLGAAAGACSVASASPCALPNPITVEGCWTCFQSLLTDCDAENPEGERRQACYEGANSFLNWCLGEVGDPQLQTGNNDSALNFEMNKGTDWDIRSNLEIEVHVPSITTNESLAVHVRLQEGENAGSIRLDDDQYWVLREMHGNDPVMRVIVDTSSVDIADNSSVGIVVALEHQGAVQNGFAFVAGVEDSFDLNGDGAFTQDDRVEAVSRYLGGEMGYDRFMRIITTR